MHRDQKIGLSMAVLVIGFAGAFCFRHEPLNLHETLAVDQATEVDRRIEQLPVRAYTEREGVGEILRQTDLLDPSSDLIDASVVERPVEPLEIRAEAGGDGLPLFAGPPEPVPTAPHATDDPTVPVGEVMVVSEQTLPRPACFAAEDGTRSPQADADSRSSAATQSSARTYIVRSGDTLSGISLKMYGTSRRYLDLYQANRDVLGNPNDLPVGTTLRIP